MSNQPTVVHQGWSVGFGHTQWQKTWQRKVQNQWQSWMQKRSSFSFLTRLPNASASSRNAAPGELLQRGLSGQRADRLGELPHLADRGFGGLERERAAQREADPEAVPAAEPLADHSAAAVEPDAREGAAEDLAVLRNDGRSGSRELLLVPGELAHRLADGDQLGDQVASRDTNGGAHVAADEPAVDRAGPVAEQMAEAFVELRLGEQLLPGVYVTLLDRVGQQLDELLVGRDAAYDLRELKPGSAASADRSWAARRARGIGPRTPYCRSSRRPARTPAPA